MQRVTTATVPPRPDVVLLADTTGSMGGPIHDVKVNAQRIVQELSAVQPEARFAIAEYRDDGDEFAFRLNRDLTPDPALVQSAVNDWQADGGGDHEEAGLNALALIATGAVTFRENSSPILVVFGDAASHDPSFGHDLPGTIAALNARGIRVVAVDVNPGGYGLDERGQFREIADRTSGVLLNAATAGEVSTAILAGIRAIQSTVTASVRECEGPVTAGLDPAERTLDSGGSVDLTLSVRVDPEARNGEYTCRIAVAVDGIVREESPGRLVVTVTGAAPDVPVLHSDATVIDLGESMVGQPTPTRQVTLSNTGEYPLSLVSTLDPQGAPEVFGITRSTCGPLLAVGESCLLEVGATPRTVGAASTLLTLASSTDTGGQAAQALTLSVAGRTPTLEFNPGVGRPGQVVTGIGRDFPPGQPVRLTWAGGSGGVTVTADPDGRFAVPMVVFPDGVAGPRTALATLPAVGTVTSGTFLVQTPTSQPGVFTRRR